MTQTTFQATPRSLTGKKTSALRREKLVPGNIYGQGESTMVVFPQNDFVKLYAQAGETGLVYVTVEGEKKARPVLIGEVQANPVTGDVIHVAFKQVNLSEKITAEIPVVLEGELSVHGAVLVTVRNSVEVEALPTDLPESFVINVEAMTEIGQSVTLSDLEYDKSKVTLMVAEEDMTLPVVMVQEQKEEVEETSEESTEVAGEASTAETAESSEAAAE